MARDWLTRESERWADEGLITQAQREAILSRYPEEDVPPLFGGATLSWLAWLVAGFGMILLVAWNWEGLPHVVKIGSTGVLTLGAYGAAATAVRGGKAARAELLAFAGALLAGACIAAVTDAWNLGDTPSGPLFAWAAVIAVTALVAASPATAALGAGVLLFWAMTGTGRPPASWAFLLIFPILALALERRSHWLAAGTVSVALGGWIALTAMELWRLPSAAPAAFLLAVGAAIDAWAHRGPGRQPAFARTTPALAFSIAGFAFLTTSALSRSGLGLWMSDPAAMSPAMVLLGALLIVAIWSPGVSHGFPRPRVIGLIALAWTAMWITTGALSGMPAALAWVWLLVSSGGLVGIAISAIRESGTVQSRAVLLAGVGSILTLILVHVTAGPNRFGRSALVLLVSAAALWWSTSQAKTTVR